MFELHVTLYIYIRYCFRKQKNAIKTKQKKTVRLVNAFDQSKHNITDRIVICKRSFCFILSGIQFWVLRLTQGK